MVLWLVELFDKRWKCYAAWPIVIWCRLRRHKDTARFLSGDDERCAECGDLTRHL